MLDDGVERVMAEQAIIMRGDFSIFYCSLRCPSLQDFVLLRRREKHPKTFYFIYSEPTAFERNCQSEKFR